MREMTDSNSNNNTSGGQLNVKDVVPNGLEDVLKIKTFNDMQTAIARQIIDTDLNIVVAAPTGSGKTVVHELAIIRAIHKASKPSAVSCTKLFGYINNILTPIYIYSTCTCRSSAYT